MRLTGKQIIVCFAIGTGLAIRSGMPSGNYSFAGLIGSALGSSLLFMFVAMMFNLIARRKASQKASYKCRLRMTKSF